MIKNSKKILETITIFGTVVPIGFPVGIAPPKPCADAATITVAPNFISENLKVNLQSLF